MVMDVRKTVILAKLETTYDSDPTPTGSANALLAKDVDIKENSGVVERDVQWAFLDKLPSVLGERWSEISFKLDVIGSGTAGTAPRIGALLRACGHSETVLSVTSVTYAPSSDNHASVTIYVYKDGRLHIMTGCKGNVKFTFNAAKTLIAEFNFMGRYATPTVVALPSTTYETPYKTPPVCKSSAFTYNSKTTLVVATVELDAANDVVKRMSLSDSNAIKGFEIVDRKPVVTIDPEAQYESSFDFRGDQLTTTRQISVVATRAAGNIVTMTVPQFNITKVEYADRDGIQVEKIEGEASASAGNDSYSVVFT